MRSTEKRLALAACVAAALAASAVAAIAQTSIRAETEAFRQARQVEIGGPGGWITLVALQWLSPGRYTIGRGASNAIVLPAPSSPDRLGELTVDANGATLKTAPGVTVGVAGRAVTSADLRPGVSYEDAPRLAGMRMVVIRRGARLGLRIWDDASPARAAFKGLKWVAIDPAWRIDARFVPHAPVPRMKIGNVLGETLEMANPGYVEFVVHGQTVRLEALLESADARQLFFMFRDGTSAKMTYGAGRYLYTDLPKDGRVIVDFNRAMNPPCAFTTFATCPLPPASNRLTLPIAAGELNDGHGR